MYPLCFSIIILFLVYFSLLSYNMQRDIFEFKFVIHI